MIGIIKQNLENFLSLTLLSTHHQSMRNSNSHTSLLFLGLEPGHPHRCPPFVFFEQRSAFRPGKHACLGEVSHPDHAQGIEKSAGQGPGLPHIHCKDPQRPPPQLLPKIVWVPRVPPQACTPSSLVCACITAEGCNLIKSTGFPRQGIKGNEENEW